MGEPSAEWLEAARDLPCALYLGAVGARCGATPTRHYLPGRRCWTHAPVAITPVPRKENRRG